MGKDDVQRYKYGKKGIYMKLQSLDQTKMSDA
jgi:hypothetical protein